MVSKENTPQLVKAGEQGLRFTNHRALSGWTGANIVSLLSGVSPFESGVHTRGQSIDPKLVLPLEQLGKNGYTVQGLQPFMSVDLYKNLGLELSGSGYGPKLWMAEKKNANEPFFLWYHYLNTHLPYRGKIPNSIDLSLETSKKLEKVRKQATIHFNETHFTNSDSIPIKQLQSFSIRQFDQWFGLFWNFFIQAGFFRDSILIITADHGDEHGERGLVGHASTTLAGHLHEEIVRIPLFIWLPDKIPADSLDTNRLSSHLDIMKTLLPLVRITPQHHLEGQNLLLPATEQRWFGMTSSGGFNEPDPENIRYFAYSYLEDNWKVHLRIDKDKNENNSLYNLRTDPFELDNLISTHPRVYKQLRHTLLKKIATRTRRPIAGQNLRETQASDLNKRSTWIFPPQSGTYSFEQLEGEIVLHWTGDPGSSYILEYIAGIGKKQITGTLEIEGNKKEFGKFDRYFWETWIVPRKRFQMRIRRIDQSDWSSWLTLEVQP